MRRDTAGVSVSDADLKRKDMMTMLSVHMCIWQRFQHVWIYLAARRRPAQSAAYSLWGLKREHKLDLYGLAQKERGREDKTHMSNILSQLKLVRLCGSQQY